MPRKMLHGSNATSPITASNVVNLEVPTEMVPPTNGLDDVSDEEELFKTCDAIMAEAEEYIYVFELEEKAKDTSMKSIGEVNASRLDNTEKSTTMRNGKEVCLVDDISNGLENIQLRAMNGVDCDKPLGYIYTAKIIYPKWFRPIKPDGCNCFSGCSDTNKCLCVLRNGGEIPFNEEGGILRAKDLVHECGPLCKCPPTCMNRVTQHGPKCQLEIFKTKLRGWGLRSRSSIKPGDFICEYIGELLHDKEAEQRVGEDEYLFDLSVDGFSIDAAKYGNIGRFINHSCSPNTYGQEILYDHDDKRMPHIAFFATKKIPPLTELTYNYSYEIDRVRDEHGNIKKKDCHCGSRNCSKRLY